MTELKLPYEMMKLNSSILIIPKEYQRTLRPNGVENIVADFDERIANEPKVSYRGGCYNVFDGQHTIQARKMMNGGNDLDIFCKVYFGMTDQEEARLFAKQTGEAVALTPSAKLRANIFGCDEQTKAFVEATENAGVHIGFERAGGIGRIICISTAFSEFCRVGPEIYTEALSVILTAWDGVPESFRAELVQGVIRFVELYHDKYNKNRLITRLSEYKPNQLYLSALSDNTLKGRKRFVGLIFRIYNGTNKKGALPVMF